MSSRARVLLVLVLLLLPVAVLLVAERIHPPAFVWQKDPIVLLVSRTPVALFPGTTRVEALRNSLKALYKDGARLNLIYLDDPPAARQELDRQVRRLRESGVEVTGSDPDFRYQSAESGDRFGRIVRAENTVVQVTALTESSLRFHFLSVPLLVDQSGQSLGRSWLREHLVATIACLATYLVLCVVLCTMVFRAGRHGRRSGLPQ